MQQAKHKHVQWTTMLPQQMQVAEMMLDAAELQHC